MAVDDDFYKKINAKNSELEKLPLCLKNILRIDYVDSDIPYKRMFNDTTKGALYGQHSIRRISLMADYETVLKLAKDE